MKNSSPSARSAARASSRVGTAEGEDREIQKFVERFRYKATKARQVQSRIKQLEKMEITELEGPQKSVSFKFPECPRSGREVLKAEGLASATETTSSSTTSASS